MGVGLLHTGLAGLGPRETCADEILQADVEVDDR